MKVRSVGAEETQQQHLLDGLQRLRVFLLRLFDLSQAAAPDVDLHLLLERADSLEGGGKKCPSLFLNA